MATFSDIAKDYLANLDVLVEARKEFEQGFAGWWADIVGKAIKPMLEKEAKCPCIVWPNQSRLGHAEFDIKENKGFYVSVLDPRASDRPFYTVSLRARKQPILKAVLKNTAVVQQLDELAVAQGVADATGLKWSGENLAQLDIEPKTDDPRANCEAVCDGILRLFRICIAQNQLMKQTEKP